MESDTEEMDDPQEVIMEGSDEEFGSLDEIENGNIYHNTLVLINTCVLCRYGLL